MSRSLVSLVLSTYQRAHLLKRSLVCYNRQAFPKQEFELVVIDDGSTDHTHSLLKQWSHDTGIRTTVLTPHPKKTGWRDCGACLNYGIRAAQGKHIILTHPEVMPGVDSVAGCVDALERFECGRAADERRSLGLYACCRVYYLSPRDQARIDTVPWETEGALAVREIDGFYDEDTNGNPDYTHRATDMVAQPGSRLPTWESWVFGGCSRETWKRLGGMLETQLWGSVDIGWLHRRRTLGIPNHTCPEDSTIVLHQNHDGPGDVPTNRDMDAWVRELKSHPLNDPAKMMWPAVDHLGW